MDLMILIEQLWKILRAVWKNCPLRRTLGYSHSPLGCTLLDTVSILRTHLREQFSPHCHSDLSHSLSHCREVAQESVSSLRSPSTYWINPLQKPGNGWGKSGYCALLSLYSLHLFVVYVSEHCRAGFGQENWKSVPTHPPRIVLDPWCFRHKWTYYWIFCLVDKV